MAIELVVLGVLVAFGVWVGSDLGDDVTSSLGDGVGSVLVGAHPIIMTRASIRTANVFMMCFIASLLTVLIIVVHTDISIYCCNYQYTAGTDIINKGPFRPDWRWCII